MAEEETRVSVDRVLKIACPARKDKKCSGECAGQEFKCLRCKHWRPYCFGHGDGDECIDCYARIMKRIVVFVRSASWRREDTIIQKLLTNREPTLTCRRIEDMLFELVTDKTLEWFGAEEEKVGPDRAGSDPLKYRYIGKSVKPRRSTASNDRDPVGRRTTKRAGRN